MAWYERTQQEDLPAWTELQTDEGLTYFYNTETKATSWERPEELMNDEDRARQGDWVWLPDEVDCFVPGKIVNKTPQYIIVENSVGETKKFDANERMDELKWSSLQRITPDLVLLDSMSTPLILHNLRKRFESGDIYTNIGMICISINPYTYLDPPIYGEEVINKYRIKLSDHKQMPPHVYCIGDNAYKNMSFKGGQNQSVIISGESGAGKTEAAKQVVNYVSSVAGSVSGIEQFLFVSNPILESFGNAKTIRNNNSSRFGKYMEMFFDKELRLISAHVTNYLLEKIRVPNPMENERNYHIFYQLCRSNTKYVNDFSVSDPENFNYLSKGNCTNVDGIDDYAEFQDTFDAMNKLMFSESEINDIFRIVAGILHLGNIEIQNAGSSVQVAHSESFRVASNLFGVSESELNYRLTTRKIRIRNQEPVDVPLKHPEALDARDACAKFIYSNLFDWIVAKLNKMMHKTQSNLQSIGILDIFGFEIFKENSFEQMCINYTNEQLQQIFNMTVFKKEEQLYKSENLNFKHVPFIDNEPIIKLIEERPYGILSLLDEESRIPEGSEEKFLNKLNDAQRSCKYFSVNERGEPGKFILTHYAGPVSYKIENFIEKNKDTLTQDLLEMVTKSDFRFLAGLFPVKEERGDRLRKETLGMQFKKQLNVLIKNLRNTEPHYIRCVKPNEEKAPLTFVAKNCKEQLTYAGVFEAVKIRKTGYPFHLRHGEFVERYGFLVQDSLPRNSSGCKQIVSNFQLNEENVKTGRTMMLYRAEEHRLLELKRSIEVEKRELEGKLRTVLAEDVNSKPENEKEPYYERLAMLVRTAKRFKLESANSREAERLLEYFIEARIDPETKAIIEAAFNSVDFDQLVYAVQLADEYNYQTKACKNCRKLLRYITRIRKELGNGLDVVDKRTLEVCVAAADNCGYKSDDVESARRLIALGKEKFITEQIRASVRRKELNRQIRLEIAFKEIILEKSGNFYSIVSYGNLLSADEWASKRFFGKEKFRNSFLKWQKDPLHAPLCIYKIPDKNKYKKVKKMVMNMFKHIQVFMGDIPPSKKQPYNKNVAINVLKMCINTPEIRNEFYIQVVKQLSNNPNKGSMKKGYDMMILGLNSFAPGKALENQIYYFLMQNCPAVDKNRFLVSLQSVILIPNGVIGVPSMQQFDEIVAGKNVNQPQFTDKAPPTAPTWEDLLKGWDEQEEEEEEIMFTATRMRLNKQPSFKAAMPKNTTSNTPIVPTEAVTGFGAGTNTKRGSVSKDPKPDYTGPWLTYIDTESGHPYYYNTETEETTWDKPDEMY